MLFRRVAEHVKEQNWFAVGIDFFIVVVGVFIGIQVANWNERHNDAQRAENYLQRLSQEMVINRRTLSGRQESYAQQIELGLLAVNRSLTPTNSEQAWKIIHSYFQASHAFTIALQRGTYDEIISAGDLALLNDQELVNALSDFYSFGGFSTIRVIPDYRENVRRIVPFQLQRYLQSDCYQIIEPDTHQLLECPPPSGGQNLIEVATEIQADVDLNRDLQYMLGYAGVSSDIARNRMKRADDLLAMLAKKTDSQ